MTTIKIDLNKLDYSFFDSSNNEIDLKEVNFIYGKNGSGKSTLCKLIKTQYSENYKIWLFDGFNSVMKDERLNAVVLGEINGKVKEEIQEIDAQIESSTLKLHELQNELKTLEWKEEYVGDGLKKSELLIELEKIDNIMRKQERKIDSFYSAKAREIKKLTSIGIVKGNYNKNNFKEDINSAKKLDEGTLANYQSFLSEEQKSDVNHPYDFDFPNDSFQDSINALLAATVDANSNFIEFDNSIEKLQFAKRGVEIHRAGEKCSFCGNIIHDNRYSQLEHLFRSEDIVAFQSNLSNKKFEVSRKIDSIQILEQLNIIDYYQQFHEKIETINSDILFVKKETTDYLREALRLLEQKMVNPFESINPIQFTPIINIENLCTEIVKIVDQHNELNVDFSSKKEEVKKSLLNHYVFLKLNEEEHRGWKGLNVELANLERTSSERNALNSKISNKIESLTGTKNDECQNSIFYFSENIERLEYQRRLLLKKTQNTELVASRINDILSKAGVYDIKLILAKNENNVEHYQINGKDGTRPITKLSTGEMNVISFLYFMENLEARDTGEQRIIIFDDPMNSNDDYMQYLIITEIQKLYRGNYRNRFNKKTDFFLCMTHNTHFYLNVQPQGNYKTHVRNPNDPDGNKVEVTKYDKNNFYFFDRGLITKVKSQKEDINTQYESLWMELNTLYNQNLLNSMLNSMRRILETYIHFNKKDTNNFYEGLEHHKKIFDVNSHAIDDPSVNIIGASREQILQMFSDVFEKNNGKEHYQSYEGRWSKN